MQNNRKREPSLCKSNRKNTQKSIERHFAPLRNFSSKCDFFIFVKNRHLWIFSNWSRTWFVPARLGATFKLSLLHVFCRMIRIFNCHFFSSLSIQIQKPAWADFERKRQEKKNRLNFIFLNNSMNN